MIFEFHVSEAYLNDLIDWAKAAKKFELVADLVALKNKKYPPSIDNGTFWSGIGIIPCS